MDVTTLDRRRYLMSLGEGLDPIGPERYREDPRAYPEIVSVRRTPMGCGTVVLVAGPLGTDLELRLRWPDGSETDEIVPRPKVCNLPPPRSHFGERWIVSGRGRPFSHGGFTGTWLWIDPRRMLIIVLLANRTYIQPAKSVSPLRRQVRATVLRHLTAIKRSRKSK